MDKLHYYFDREKLIRQGQTDPDAYVKGVFQTLFRNTTIPAGKTVSLQTEIFETIWANNGLRQSLFPNLTYANKTLDELKLQALLLFQGMIASASNSFYSFIIVK